MRAEQYPDIPGFHHFHWISDAFLKRSDEIGVIGVTQKGFISVNRTPEHMRVMRLRRDIGALEKQKATLQRRIGQMQGTIRRLKEARPEEGVDEIDFVAEGLAQGERAPEGRRYSEEAMMLYYIAYLGGPSTYGLFRTAYARGPTPIALPSERHLRRKFADRVEEIERQIQSDAGAGELIEA